jgi:hypothetical protein
MQAMALDTHPTPTIRLIPATMGTTIRVPVTVIKATATGMAVRITALIGATIDALLAESIGDGIAGR